MVALGSTQGSTFRLRSEDVTSPSCLLAATEMDLSDLQELFQETSASVFRINSNGESVPWPHPALVRAAECTAGGSGWWPPALGCPVAQALPTQDSGVGAGHEPSALGSGWAVSSAGALLGPFLPPPSHTWDLDGPPGEECVRASLRLAGPPPHRSPRLGVRARATAHEDRACPPLPQDTGAWARGGPGSLYPRGWELAFALNSELSQVRER